MNVQRKSDPDAEFEPVLGQAAYQVAVDDAVSTYRASGAALLIEAIRPVPEAWRRSLLSPGEVERLDSFLFDNDRNLYLAAHSLKRLVLAGITGRRPKDLVFGCSRNGRPFLMLDGWRGDFNLSHSGKRVALAIVARGRVGVDVQEPGDRYVDLHEKLRHPDEVDLFPDRRDFLLMWTLKEAVSKAVGTGLGEQFETLRMECAPREGGLYLCNGWSCRHTVLEQGYHLSVATDLARMGAVAQIGG